MRFGAATERGPPRRLALPGDVEVAAREGCEVRCILQYVYECNQFCSITVNGEMTIQFAAK